MQNITKELTRVNDIAAELDKAFFDIPFGNSAFQIENFIINAALTPARAYRAIGLGMSTKINDLRDAYYKLKKEDIDIEELRDKLANPAVNRYDRARIGLEIDQKREARRYTHKLINDALAELDCFYRAYKKLPPITRAEFEAEERKHFEIKLGNQAAGITGALESLDNIRIAEGKITG